MTILNHLTTKEVAEHFGRTVLTVQGWCRTGILPAVQVKRRGTWLISPEALESFTPPRPGPVPVSQAESGGGDDLQDPVAGLAQVLQDIPVDDDVWDEIAQEPYG